MVAGFVLNLLVTIECASVMHNIKKDNIQITNAKFRLQLYKQHLTLNFACIIVMVRSYKYCQC
jgi:hypothetical protein